MDGAMTLKNNERRQGLGRPGTCGAGISVWTGGKRIVTVKAGLMGNIIYGMEGNEGADLIEANWALMRAKTRYVKVYKFISIVVVPEETNNN